MMDCWNFFRYAKLFETEEIFSLVDQNYIWFSHLNKNHFINKIKKKECIYENGVLITFKILKIKGSLGSYEVNAGNTILEQIIKNKKKSNSELVKHVFIKFINCALGSVYLAVNKRNTRAVNFYRNMNMAMVGKTKLGYSDKRNLTVDGYIYKSKNIYLERSIS